MESPRLPSMPDLLLQGCHKLMDNGNANSENTPVFRTGSGKPVTLNQSSLSKALSILGDGDHLFHTAGLPFGLEDEFGYSNSGEAVGKQNSLKKIPTVSNSMFKTGSGKAVNISETGLNKAKTLLGVGENNRNSFEDFESFKKESIPYHLDQSSCATAPMQMSSFVGQFNSSLYNSEATPDFVLINTKPPPIKFHTAGGRSISVSTDALQRARSLLGDPELGDLLKEDDEANPFFQVPKEIKFNDKISITASDTSTPFHDEKEESSNSSSKNFTSPLRSASYLKPSAIRLQNIGRGNNLIQRFNAEADERGGGKYSDGKSYIPKVNFQESGICPRKNQQEFPPGRGLVDITNTAERLCIESTQNFGEKRRLGIKSSPSPFKKPRNSRFITPLSKSIPPVPSIISNLAPRESCLKERVSTRYPFQKVRPYIQEYVIEAPHSCQFKMENLSDDVRKLNSASAASYLFQDESGSQCVGSEAFYHMLSQSGVSMQYISKDWVANHYKWIVWKLACYERCYPAKFSGRILTVLNVLEELKYRYEREVNYGHRSAIKRIVEGDSQSSSQMVLCISSVCSPGNFTTEFQSIPSDGADNCPTAKIELTDGWYSLYAVLDILLTRQLASGKLFVGQKLRIWGAALVGWVGPTSPLEASESTSLQLNMNGTYKAHWADRLGFCKGQGLPLAFRSIKSAGGPVPCTVVGISRVYPILYRERVTGGRFIVRSERMESKAVHLFNQRCSSVVEGIVSDFQCVGHDQDSEEGAKIFNMLETAAEPDLLMAEMTTEQLSSFASYRAKVETRRQSDIQRLLEKSLEACGLSKRDVTPFMRVRVVGITNKSKPHRSGQQDGLITIWNPTGKQEMDMVEGQTYAVSGLIPVSSDQTTIYLQARGSTSRWLSLSHLKFENFDPRRSISVAKLGDVPLSSEFDIAAFVIHVGDLYTEAYQMKQWVFVSDGSVSALQSGEPLESVLAIKFCSPCPEHDLVPLLNCNLAGSTVGFCNLIKRAKDNMNNLWVAEATENSNYYLSYNDYRSKHLRDSAEYAQNWARVANLTIEKLKEKVISIIGHCNG